MRVEDVAEDSEPDAEGEGEEARRESDTGGTEERACSVKGGKSRSGREES